MTTIDKSQSPYYDDYNLNKRYTQMLAVPGRVEQARDYTQMQTMVYDFLQRLSDTIFKNGSVISGMGFVMKTSSILVENGKVYLNGKIHLFLQQEIPITKVGIETVGVKLQEIIVTEDDDSSLLDPTTSTGNFGQPGTHRIQSTVILTLNDPDSSTLYEFQDGDLTIEVPRPQFDGLSQMLAQRTYDESGNYRVRGLDLNVDPYDANNVSLIVEAGTAYIKGYQVIKPTPIKNLVPISKSYRSVVGEPKSYTSTATKYLLNNVPAKSITQVTAYVPVTDESVTRGSTPGGTDFLKKTPVVDVTSVVAGGTTYIRGTDWQLTSNGIDWSLSGAEPTTGSTYTVNYTYNKTLIQGVDYQQYSEIGDFGETKDYVQFITNGDKPTNNSTFWINYDFFLARMDAVSMDKDGNVIITSGQPDIPRNVTAPVVTDPSLLPIGTVYLPPNSGGAIAKFSTVTRLEMADLQKISQRVDDLEFNQAITALDRDTMNGESPTDLRGIFSDSFRSMDRADLTSPLFTAMYDLEYGTLMLPLSNTKVTKPAVSTTNAIKQWQRVGTVPMTEILAASQSYATTTMLVNPYLAFNSMGTLGLTPQVDNWIEDDYILIQNTQFQARNFWRWWAHNGDHKSDVSDLFGLQIVSGAPVGTDVADWRPAWEGANTFPSATAVKTDKSRNIVDEAITYMRQITVQIYAKNLQPATDNLTLTFDGVQCNLTPLAGYNSGSIIGTVRANSSGEVKATFTIPANVRTGTREVILSNSSNTASTSFTSIGTKETTVDTITTTYITLTAIDPIAQTFQFDRDTVLTSVGGYFAAKDATTNVKVQIRNVVNGYPGNVIFGEQIVTPGQINISDNASVETKVTFDNPVICLANTQYCMVFLVDSAIHSMYVCDLGQNDITTGVQVTREPYLPGLLFSSSNGIAWTAHQSMNLKFNIYKAQFNTNTTIEFVEQTSMNADRLLLLADATVPTGSTCTWQISLDGGNWQPITPYSDLDLLKVADKVKLRVIITTDGNNSPMIALDSLVLTGFTTGLSGTYVGRNVELVSPVTNVTQIYDAHIPSGCSVTPQFSYDNGTTWITPTQISSTPMSADYTRFICQATISLSANALNFRARLNISSNDPTLRPTAQRFANIMK